MAGELIESPSLPPGAAAAVAEVMKRLRKGYSEEMIREDCEADETLSQWPVDDLLSYAADELATAAADADVIRGWCAECSREVYRRAMNSGDMPTALRALKQIAQLVGVC